MTISSTKGYTSMGQKVFGFGSPGTGKTTQIISLEKAGLSPIIANRENGLTSVSEEELPFIDIDSWAKYLEVLNWYELSAEAKQFGILCTDSFTDLGEDNVEYEVAKVKDPRQGYYAAMTTMEKTLRQIRDSKRNHFVIAKEEYEKDESKSVLRWQPQVVSKSVGPKLVGVLDYSIRFIKETINGVESFKFQCKETFDCVARVRDPKGTIQLYEPADLGAFLGKVA